jgi:ELWxxDGT repeat protein
MLVLLHVVCAGVASAFTPPAMVLDINPGAGDSSPVVFYALGGQLVFFASDGATGSEPWVSDGTAAGTFRLRDVWPGANGGFNVFCPTCNAVSNGTTVFFSASDGTAGAELWRTDGTPGGTSKVLAGVTASGLGIVGSRVFFTGNSQLYASDGTPGGTGVVSNTSLATGTTDLLDVGGIAYYSGSDGFSGNELWRSDGTPGGTQRVKDLNPGSPDANPTNLTNVGGTLYFTATNGTGGALYKTDGTSLGTVLLRQGTTAGGAVGDRKQLLNVNGIVYFVGSEATHGQELWRSDGTPAGTFMVKDIYPGAGGGLAGSSLVGVGNTIFFAAGDDTHGDELWKSDGTDAGTVMVKDINAGLTGSFPKQLANIDGTLFFRAQSGFAAGDQPWTSDGTEAGTQQWASIRPANASGASMFTLAGGRVFFAANDGTHGLELWSAGPTLGVAPGERAGSIVLSQSRPNPTRSLSAISYTLAATQHVSLKLYDAQGRALRTLVDQAQGAGQHRVDVDARGLTNGVYFYRLTTGGEVRERKLVIEK